MKKYFVLFFFITIFLSACSSKQSTPQLSVNNAPINEPIADINTLDEITKPNLSLPADINSGQIQKYFLYGNIYYALVMQSSMNILLDAPVEFKPQFVGLLKANEGDNVWSKFIEIKDKIATDKNNPYYLWLDNKQLYLSVVDQNGAGSGEGIMKLFLIADDKTALNGCYYYPGTPTEIDYFSHTRNIGKFESQPLEICNNVQINLIK
ncbi:MAG: hypothetical protein NTX82_01155 [Candidatus Parcubacteria bacterium]|nr:hypothetical protein [Candidatus Parcubacteria bacterium]